MRVLIVEDDPGVRVALESLAAGHGFEVTQAEDGKEAWKRIQDEQFPIVVTDWLMPQMDGLELLHAIRSQPDRPYSYVIILTGHGDHDAYRRLMDAGADDFLTKPLRREELLARLNVARRIMRLQQELADANASLREINEELEFFRSRVQRELEAAARFQESLLPVAFPDIPGIKVSWWLHSCEELAGDILNIVHLDDSHVGCYVLDVSGHGVCAALLSAQLSRMLNPESPHSQLLRPTIDEPPGYSLRQPSEVMSELNGLFRMDPTDPRFFTLVYGILDLEDRKFRFSCGGHPGPIHIRNASKPHPLLVPGSPIGMFGNGKWGDAVIDLNQGDRIALYSDGLVEAMNPQGEMFGDARLLDLLGNHRQTDVGACCGAVMQQVETWCGTTRLQDDCSLLLLEVS
jgi:sigma-B regulation protein RsbU (phosphoserine phosphatase)